MNSSITAFLISAGAVTLAEMGDKTQLLAMAMATRFKVSKVMVGVFIATVLNHVLAVAVGSFVTRFHAISVVIQALAALSFIFFGLWTIRGDKLEGEENRTTKFGAIMTVAIAFFIAELGDKTQLATIALAARYPDHPIYILMGTTTGMLIADGLGIFIGVVLCKKIPQRTVKLISAGAFILFGFIGTYQVARENLLWSIPLIATVLIVLAGATGVVTYRLLKREPAPDLNNAILKCNREKDDQSA